MGWRRWCHVARIHGAADCVVRTRHATRRRDASAAAASDKLLMRAHALEKSEPDDYRPTRRSVCSRRRGICSFSARYRNGRRQRPVSQIEVTGPVIELESVMRWGKFYWADGHVDTRYVYDVDPKGPVLPVPGPDGRHHAFVATSTTRRIVDPPWRGQAPRVWLQKSCAIALPILCQDAQHVLSYDGRVQ
jgi:hypothetical protein